MTSDGIEGFKLDDYTDSVKAEMGATRHRAFPVTDSKGRYIGTVSRRNLLNIRKKQVILVTIMRSHRQWIISMTQIYLRLWITTG